jgi:hypothetical protein
VTAGRTLKPTNQTARNTDHGIDPAYRISADGGIEILNNGGALKKHVTGMELVDLVIGGNVLAIALTMGVVLFACDSGVDVMPMLETSESLPVVQTMQLMALMIGWPLPEVVVSHDQTEIHLKYMTGSVR